MAHPFFDVPRPTVIGHRGAAGEAPENTLVSFERALADGAAILESDVHLTRDGVPVLIHDDAVDRTTNGSGRVAAFALEELRRLDAGHRFTPDAGRSHRFRGRGHRVPTLQEAFEAFPMARFNLELKEKVPGIVERCLEIVAGAGREARTLLTAGDDALMADLRARIDAAALPVAQGASTGDVLAFIRSAIERTAPSAGPMALQVPAEFGDRPLVTPAFVEHAHAHGLFVHVWIVNDPDEMRHLLAMGVDGIVTDFPAHLGAVVAGATPA
ncbi:MAG: glycerophosphodiester phosphodiesterase [Myxococcales bacterium]|nr:glycerophosphodiester phosphodiesterase [Myxococcales bacterium]